MGFPNKIADDPILSLVLTDLDGYDYRGRKKIILCSYNKDKK